MKQKITLSILFVFSCFLSIHADDYHAYISFKDPSCRITPLSERGQAYFKEHDAAAEAARYGFIANQKNNATQLVEYGNVAIGIEQGNLVSYTTWGPYGVSASIDPVSMFYLLKAGSMAIARLLDINGHYYRYDLRTMREDLLYAIDAERYHIYHAHDAWCRAYDADFAYLMRKKYELEVASAACGSKKSAARSAALEAQEIVESLLRSIASKTVISPETKYTATIKALEHAIEQIRNTKFKHKKDKKRVLCEYEQALAREELRYHAFLAQQAAECAQQKAIQLQRSAMQQRCLHACKMLQEDEEDQALWHMWDAEYYPTIASVLDARAVSLQAIKKQGPVYQTRSYALSPHANVLLAEAGCNSTLFTECYGNQYQQSLQHEAVAIVEEAAHIHTTSVVYQHLAAIVQCVEAACAYNAHGDMYHATAILDLCWSLLAWGATITHAVVEGAVAGAIGAAVDLYEHPVHAAVSILVGSRVMLAYQLSKVVYTVADLGITALVDYGAACEKWETYIEPVNNVIDAIRNKQVSLADAVKGVTRCGVQLYAQAKLLNGLQSLYDGVKIQAVAYMHSHPNSTPAAYRATPQGQLLKAATEDMHACQTYNGLPPRYSVTSDGRVIWDATFNELGEDISAYIGHGMRNVMRSVDGEMLESGVTGALAAFNNLQHTKDRETVGEMLARLAPEKAETGGGMSPQGPKKDDDDKNKKDRSEWRPLTNKEARAEAKILGFVERSDPPFNPHKQLAFYDKKNNLWITPDADGHNGGIWKMFRGTERLGTYNKDLTTRIKD